MVGHFQNNQSSQKHLYNRVTIVRRTRARQSKLVRKLLSLSSSYDQKSEGDQLLADALLDHTYYRVSAMSARPALQRLRRSQDNARKQICVFAALSDFVKAPRTRIRAQVSQLPILLDDELISIWS